MKFNGKLCFIGLAAFPSLLFSAAVDDLACKSVPVTIFYGAYTDYNSVSKYVQFNSSDVVDITPPSGGVAKKVKVITSSFANKPIISDPYTSLSFSSYTGTDNTSAAHKLASLGTVPVTIYYGAYTDSSGVSKYVQFNGSDVVDITPPSGGVAKKVKVITSSFTSKPTIDTGNCKYDVGLNGYYLMSGSSYIQDNEGSPIGCTPVVSISFKSLVGSSCSVTPTNTAPTLTLSASTATVNTGSTTTVTLTKADTESNTVTVTGATSNSGVATVSVSGTTATITGVAAGTATITLTPNDGTINGTAKTVTVTVTNGVQPTNTPPTVNGTTVANLTIPMTQTTVDVASLFSDVESNIVSYTTTFLLSEMGFTYANGQLTATTTLLPGTYNGTVTATDSGGLSVTTNRFTITITSSSSGTVERPPEVPETSSVETPPTFPIVQ
jgi:hypothetical protein